MNRLLQKRVSITTQQYYNGVHMEEAAHDINSKTIQIKNI